MVIGNSLKPKVGLVVPTLGTRPEYLNQCLESIHRASAGILSPFVVLVAPREFNAAAYLSRGLVQEFIHDPGLGLAGAINEGITKMPSHVEYVNWLGDDDLLTEGSLASTALYLDKNPQTVLVFGGCDYVDGNGDFVWSNPSGQWAVPLLRIGPDLIPQPGSLFRKSSFLEVGQLDFSYSWAFDFDLFIKLSKIGKVRHLPLVLACFRWHPESLSVGLRKKSVAEASMVRISHLPLLLRPISWIWETPVRILTLLAGNRLSSSLKMRERDRTA